MASPTTTVHVRSPRLKVLMHKFFAEGDHRQKALVILKKSWSTVLQLQQHIQQIFRLPGDIYLTVDDGCLLPTDEDIALIAETDNVTVEPATTSKTSPSFHLLTDAFSNAHIYSANETTPGAWTSDVSSPGISFAKKRLKKTDDGTGAVVPKCKWSQDIDSLDVAERQPENIDADTNIPAKPKRQRKRKRKQAKASPEQEVVVKPAVAVQRRPTVVFRAESRPEKGHIRFGQDDDDISTDDNQSDVAAKPPPNDPFPLPRGARVIRGTRATPDVVPKRPVTRQSSALVTQGTADVAMSADQTVSEVSTTTAALKAPEAALTTANAAAPLDALETMRRNVDALNLPSVTEPLKEQDMIAFKIMKLSDDYAPGLSEFIVGMVQAIDADSGTVSVHIMAGLEQTADPLGKFSLDTDDNADATAAPIAAKEPDRTYHVQRLDMFDVKRVQL